MSCVLSAARLNFHPVLGAQPHLAQALSARPRSRIRAQVTHVGLSASQLRSSSHSVNYAKDGADGFEIGIFEAYARTG